VRRVLILAVTLLVPLSALAAFAARASAANVLLGDAAVELQDGHLGGGHAEAFRVRAQESGSTGMMYVYVGQQSTAREVAVGIYNNANGRPRWLLTRGVAPTVKPNAWTAVPVAPTRLVQGKSYWLTVLGVGGTLRYRSRAGAFCVGSSNVNHRLDVLPRVWRRHGHRRRAPCPISAYVVAGGPSSLPSEPEFQSTRLLLEGSPIVPSPSEQLATPPPAPVNSELPVVSGSAVEGQTLSASTGTWSDSPLSFEYQWQDCNTVGEGCSDIAGATSSTHKVASGDVGHTLRVVVTATNEGGSGEATSATSATVGVAAPVNSVLPVVSGAAVEGQTFSASTGSWSGNPTSYAYQWQDCNAAGEGCSNIASAIASSHKLVAGDVGHTLRIIVTATNAGGSGKASSATSALVTAIPPAPVNTGLPVVSGLAVEGQTFSATTGTWSGSPTSYAYQWQDCNTAGEGCSNIANATSSSYKLAAGDVGHTLRVLVTATNAGGSAKASSAASALVTAEGGTPVNCFGDPEGCGYPGPADTGVLNCSALPKSSGGKTITKAETIEDTNITGGVTVEASNVTFKHDCVVVNGGENIGGAAVVLAQGANNFTITESTVGGTNRTSGSIGEGLRNNYSNPGATATDVRIEYVGTPLHQNWTLEDSYLISNGEQKLAEQGVEHQEDWWFSNNTIVANHDTMLNPSKQTAVVFGETSKGSCSNHETITNSLLAGGGYMLYICANSNNTNNGSTINIKNNRFARMVCGKNERTDVESRGGFECTGEPSELVSYFDAGEGTGGYYPRGGFFGAVYEGVSIFNRGTGWEHNYWDNNLEEQPEETYCPKC